MISWLQWLKKSRGARAHWWAIAISQLTGLNIKVNPPCFQYAHARGPTKWRHKLCAERMHKANVRNSLKLSEETIIISTVLVFQNIRILIQLINPPQKETDIYESKTHTPLSPMWCDAIQRMHKDCRKQECHQIEQYSVSAIFLYNWTQCIDGFNL